MYQGTYGHPIFPHILHTVPFYEKLAKQDLRLTGNAFGRWTRWLGYKDDFIMSQDSSPEKSALHQHPNWPILYKYIHRHIYIYINTLYTFVFIYTYKYIYIYMYMFIFYTYVYICICIYRYMYINICKYVYIYICI